MEHTKYGFPCRILTPDEKSALLENLRVTSPMRLPRISFDDPYSLWLGAKPEDVLEFEIPSEAAGWSKKYR
jgi:DNA-directed RNA polymerase subunit H (RpoH/RPB5)